MNLCGNSGFDGLGDKAKNFLKKFGLTKLVSSTSILTLLTLVMLGIGCGHVQPVPTPVPEMGQIDVNLRWKLAEARCNGQPMSATTRSQLKTRVYYKREGAEWKLLAESLEGAVAYETTMTGLVKGEMVDFALEHVLFGVSSCGWSTPVTLEAK